MDYPIRPLVLPLWRMIHPAWHRQPFSGEGARLHGGRWNMKGQPALYLATDAATAVAEYYQGLPKPGTLAPYRLHADGIADLTDGHGAAADTLVAEAMADDWKTIVRIDHVVPDSWVLAEELIAAGAQGALVPSFQNRGGTAVVLWRWHDAAGDDDGARLTLLDPDDVLAARSSPADM